MMTTLRTTLFAWLLVASAWACAAEGDTAIVLLHGKWDRAPTHVMALARQLEGAGYRVATPLMPWSESRQYDASYPQALAEIEAAANALRDKGAKRIVIAGQSFGANAALAYAASGKPVDAIVGLSPGHTPERGKFRATLEPSVAKAREMAAAGDGASKASFDDLNQGQRRTVRASAQAYLSYFDPEGAANMQKSAAMIPVAIPLFMAVGTADPLAGVAEASIFQRAPKSDKSRYVSLGADHMSLLGVVGPDLLAWLQSLGD